MSEPETPEGDREIAICHVCGERFVEQRQLLAHLAQEHPDDVLPEITEP